VYHATETIATLDPSLVPLCSRRDPRTVRVRCSEGQGSVRPVAVVVVDEDVEEPLEVLLVQDQQPVETLRANGAHEPFRHPVRPRGAKRRANDLNPLASEHPVKVVGEFLVPVANEEAEGVRRCRQCPRQLPRLLGDPRRARIRRTSRDMHAAAAQFDEEEDVQPLQKVSVANSQS